MLEQFQICYHGTVRTSAISIKNKGIDLSLSAKGTDFGQGFYVTNNLAQAREWAVRYARSLQRRTKQVTYPVVMTFNIDIRKLNNLKGKQFTMINEEWGNFILQNRKNYQNYFHLSYDYAVGPLADGPMYTMLAELKEGIITEAQFIHKAYPKGKMLRYNQLSLHSKWALDCLTLKEVENVEKLQ